MVELVHVIIDTREQVPYAFSSRVVATRALLGVGDYALEGAEHLVAVERKTLADFVSSVTWERERFLREMELLRNYEVKCIVVEASLTDVFAHRYLSGAYPNAIIGSAVAIFVDYNVPVFFCSDRQACCDFTERLLLRAHEKVTSKCPAP